MAPRKTNPTSDAAWCDFVKSNISYNPETGLFLWIKDRVRSRCGMEAGTRNKAGYVVVVVGGRRIRAHRLAWLFVNGELPSSGMDMDHINGVRHDNRWANLRLATRSQNMMNRASKGKASQYHGVAFDKSRGKWLAQGKAADGTKLHQRHDTEKDAAMAYDAFAAKHHGEFAKLNFGDTK